MSATKDELRAWSSQALRAVIEEAERMQRAGLGVKRLAVKAAAAREILNERGE